jgi:hypothetical protein
MKKNNGHVSFGRSTMDYAAAATEQMELYSRAHPGSPSAVRRPQLFFRGDLWVAVLGPSVEEGIVGIGPTVAAALRAFDAQYLAGRRPPINAAGKDAAQRPGPKTFGAARGSYSSAKSSPKTRAQVSGFPWP